MAGALIAPLGPTRKYRVTEPAGKRDLDVALPLGPGSDGFVPSPSGTELGDSKASREETHGEEEGQAGAGERADRGARLSIGRHRSARVRDGPGTLRQAAGDLSDQ